MYQVRPPFQSNSVHSLGSLQVVVVKGPRRSLLGRNCFKPLVQDLSQETRHEPAQNVMDAWPEATESWTRIHADFFGLTGVRIVPSTSSVAAIEIFRELFATHGLPDCLEVGAHDYWLVFYYLITQRRTLGLTSNPAEFLIKRKLKTCLDRILPNNTEIAKRKLYRDFKIDEHVLARCCNQQNKWTKAKIVKRIGRLLYIVGTETGLLWKRHVDQI
ncbi:hypothetical protein T10_256 [Trichinella papuae]|uniref:Uncharacterized protein n=1 Tax=Trichinella papuae TaxID=268474 RepID=A0A0V1M861_9BILA|nr:hypothetical protein T10_256 [Trichinella papuae]